MLDFRRDPARHRLMFYVDTPHGRYEVERLALDRWFARLRRGGQAWPIGAAEGYLTTSGACVAAETHFISLNDRQRDTRS
jgi:hypothetical protein